MRGDTLCLWQCLHAISITLEHGLVGIPLLHFQNVGISLRNFPDRHHWLRVLLPCSNHRVLGPPAQVDEFTLDLSDACLLLEQHRKRLQDHLASVFLFHADLFELLVGKEAPSDTVEQLRLLHSG